jgi:diguanylate cyclase (GGDEF)-like protein/PAS domain S-box-containing protein
MDKHKKPSRIGKKLTKEDAEQSRKLNNQKGLSEVLKELEIDYSIIIENMLNGFALHEIILDKDGKPCDYRFLEINPSFEKLTGLKKENIIGKTALEVFPGLEPYWIDTYGKVAMTGEPVQFEHYSQSLNKHYLVNAFSPKKGYFVTIFSELGTESQNFKKYFEQYLKYTSIPFLVLDKKGHVSLINKKGVELLGYPEEDIIGKDWFINFLPEEIRSEIKEYFMKALRGEVPIDSYYENPVITKSGIKTFLWQNTLLKDAGGKIFGILASAEDITERKKMEAEIKRERTFLDQLLETDPESIVITDNSGTVLRVNNEFVHMFGYEVGEAVGQNIDDLVAPPGYHEEAKTIAESLFQGGQVSLELVRRRKDNTILNVSIIGAPIQIAGKQEAVYAIYRDITERKRMEEEMKRLATVDSLTQIFNKEAGIEILKRDIEASLSTKTPTTLVFIDANGLKLINDTYGHIEGDEYLKLIARNISDKVGEAGTVFRFGGDEFIILLPKSDKQKAAKLLNEIEKTIENLGSELQKPYEMSISYGFAVFDPEHPVSSDTLLATADKEMYKVKNSFYEHKRVRAEETLRRNEEKFKTLIETTGTGFHVLDARGRVVDANKEYIRLAGYDTLEEILGRSVVEWTAPYDLERTATELKKCIEHGFVRNLEFDYVNRNGQITPIEINASVIGSGDSAKIFALCHDITERKQAEEKIRSLLTDVQRERDKFSLLINSMYDEVWFADAEKNFTLANPSACKAFDIEKLDKLEIEKLAKSLEVLRPDGSPRPLEEAPPLCALAGETVINQEEIVRLPSSGELRYRLVNSTPIRDQEGNIIGAISVVRDITERKKMEDALRESEERFRTLYENSTIGIYRTTPDGRILLANPALIRMLGYSSFDDLLNRDLEKNGYAPSYPRSQFIEIIEKDGEVKGLESAWKRKDGTIVFVRESARAIRDSQGKTLYYDGVVEDVTERKKMEEALKKSNEQLKKMYDFQSIVRKLNQFLLVCKSEDEIYKEVCDTFMESSVIKFVWIGLIEKGTFDVKPVAYAGIEKGYINSIKAKWDNSQHGRGPTGIAIKTQKPVVIGDIRTDPTYMPWRKEALKRNYLSIISLPLIYEGAVIGVMDIYSDRKDAFAEEDIELFKEVANDIAVGIKSIRLETNLQKKSKQLEKSVENIVFTMAKMSELKDPYTAGHQQRVSQLGTAIARKMGLSQDRIEAVRFASLIHDIGKFSIPGEILTKPSKLSETEFALIKDHPKTGYDIIKDVDFPWDIASIILQHHERLDGSGYPQGLKNDEILLEAKIIGVADVVEAMSSHRPYRPALGIDKALEEISMNKERLYDPEVVDACIKLFKEDGFKFE